MPTAQFKGFDDYIEIFRGGPQTDSAGRHHDGDALIDRAVSSFSLARHEPPLVVGHPQDNAPAFGWVDGLSSTVKDGVKVLLAKFRQVAPEFEELAKAGRYKKRSASFYPDGSLRHVGFLGAAPPAVKGLADVAFHDDAGPTFEFTDSTDWAIARIFRRLREWLIEKEGPDTADRIVGDWEINDIQRTAERDELASEQAAVAAQPLFKERAMSTHHLPASFSEAELGAAVAKATEEARASVLAEFAEADAVKRAEARKQDAAAFCQAGVAAGTIIPAWVNNGLPEFMARLDGDQAISFAEGEAASPYAWFKSFLEKLPQIVEFKELAHRGQGPGNAGDDAVRLAALAVEFRDQEAAAGRVISFTQAVAHVSGQTK